VRCISAKRPLFSGFTEIRAIYLTKLATLQGKPQSQIWSLETDRQYAKSRQWRAF
jgi:hypothetical protein